MKPTRQDILTHRLFIRRQNRYENVYRKKFYRFLQSSNYAVAKYIAENGVQGWESVLNEKDVKPIYENLYNTVSIKEAKLLYETDIKTLGGNKDIITDLISILSPSQGGQGGLISLWRNLLGDFIQVRIASRITNVNNTTSRRISALIQRSIEEGLGAEETARVIRRDRNYSRNRSLAIARTETVSASIQGQMMAAYSSPFEMTKKWLPFKDERTRTTHFYMYDTPYVDLDQDFYLNGKNGLEPASQPCDNRLSASNSVNCRCQLLYKPKRDGDGRLMRKM